MAKMMSRSIDLEPIDRLEEKVKLLVGAIERMRQEQARLADDNVKLQRELEAARGRLTESEGASAEIAALRAERDQIRARVAGMLGQLEGLNL